MTAPKRWRESAKRTEADVDQVAITIRDFMNTRAHGPRNPNREHAPPEARPSSTASFTSTAALSGSKTSSPAAAPPSNGCRVELASVARTE
jgi:hypothetical protein